MARAHRIGSAAALTAAIYFLILFNVIPIPFLDPTTSSQILSVLPWWFLVSFGAYSLWTIGWGLLTLRECPEAYEELIKVNFSSFLLGGPLQLVWNIPAIMASGFSEIAEAKNDLRTKGVTVD